jgi:hypothetical protein
LLTSYRIRRNGHNLRTVKNKLPQKVLNTKLKGKCQTEGLDQSRKNRSGEMSYKTMEQKTWEETESENLWKSRVASL